MTVPLYITAFLLRMLLMIRYCYCEAAIANLSHTAVADTLAAM
jgi:hypothetical protein